MSYEIGQAHVLLIKSAADKPAVSHSLSGELYKSQSGWILLSVPNSLVRGAFDALDEPGIELPPSPEGRLNAHISVMRPEELEAAGIDADKIQERGKRFHYTLGPLQTVNPAGWDAVSKCWFIKVHSPELKQLRKSYGMTPLPNNNKFEFHITVAVRKKNVLGVNQVSKAASLIHNPEAWALKTAALGIPSRADLGDLLKLQPGLADFVIQRHLAERAGPHYDVRFGTPDTGLFSWATKHELPTPGQRRALFRQPVHSHGYGDFEGAIGEGYGKGTVSKHRKGQVLITGVTPDKIEFTTADERYPERFVLLKPDKWGEKDWLLVNRTPTEKVPYEKVRYKRIPGGQIEQAIESMQPGETLERKVDGASSLIQLLKDGVELTSYRTSKTTGRPITHTERFFGGPGKMKIPPELVGTVLKGEIYGSRNNRAQADQAGQGDGAAAGASRLGELIGPQELGGVLNATLAEALRKQKDEGISLRNMVYDIQQLGKQPVDWHKTPRAERRKMIEQVLRHLPKDKFHISEAATTPEEARKLWEEIKAKGYSPSTEGVVHWPLHGAPAKSKLLSEQDVHITGTFPGEGKYKDTGVGGFTYANEPGGETVGRLGTGLSDELRRDAYADPQAYVGRVARISSQQQFPSGAWRVPALLGLHEDYPTTKQAGLFDFLKRQPRATQPVDTAPISQQLQGLLPQFEYEFEGPYNRGVTMDQLGADDLDFAEMLLEMEYQHGGAQQGKWPRYTPRTTLGHLDDYLSSLRNAQEQSNVIKGGSAAALHQRGARGPHEPGPGAAQEGQERQPDLQGTGGGDGGGVAANKGVDPAGRVAAPAAEQPFSVVQSLRAAKAESDRQNWREKQRVLRQLMQQRPHEFIIDSTQGRYWGVTHKPTGFKLHMPAQAIPGQLKQSADAYVIKGNPKAMEADPAAYDAFYNAVKKYMEDQGVSTDFDAGEPHTQPPGGRYWIGHSRGADRLRFAPEGVRTLRLDDYEAAPHPDPGHYTFNDEQRAAIARLIKGASMYHASPHKLDKLEPRPSRVLDGEAAVFATGAPETSLPFAAKWTDDDLQYGSVDGQMYMREGRPKAFDEIFGGKEGYLYEMPDTGFGSDPRLTRFEQINKDAVQPTSSTPIKDVLKALLEQKKILIARHGEQLPWEKAAAHTLVTGHSGAGKSTLAKQLAASSGQPLVRLDHDPRWEEFLSSRGTDHYDPASAARNDYNELRRKIVADAIRAAVPSVIEGSQLAVSGADLGNHRKILVNTPELQIVRQRLARDRAKPKNAGKMPPGSRMARDRAAVTRQIMGVHRDEMDALANDPAWEKMRAKKAFLNDSFTGQAARGYLNNILAGRQPAWDPSKGALGNVTGHLGNIQDAASRHIGEAVSWDRLQNAADPNRSLQQLSSYLRGQRKPVVHHPIDIVLQARG